MEDGENYLNYIKPIYHKKPNRIDGYHIDVISFLRKIVKCRSVTPDFSDAHRIIAEDLSFLGFNTTIYECYNAKTPENVKVYNLFATLGEGKPNFLFCGHSDVVPTGEGWSFEPFGAEVIDGYVCGRGSEDMKSGIASFMSALSIFLNENKDFDGQIAVLISGAEETHSHNGVNLFAKCLKSQNTIFDVCLTGEPTSLQSVGDTYKPGRRGNVDFSSKIEGDVNGGIAALLSLCKEPLDNGELGFPPSDIVPVGVNFTKKPEGLKDSKFLKLQIVGFQGHSAYSHLAINPISIILNVVQALQDNKFKFEMVKMFSKMLAVNIIPPTAEAVLLINQCDFSKINDLITTNFERVKIIEIDNYEVDSDIAEFSVNFRYGAKWNIDSLKAEIESRINHGIDEFEAKAHNTYKGINNSYVSKGSKFAKLLEKIAYDEFGIVSKPNFGGGTSDTRHLIREGVCLESVDLGVQAKTMHKVDEQTSIEGLQNLTFLYKQLLKHYFIGA